MVGVITGVNVVDSVPDHEIESVACTIDEQGSNVLSLDTIFHTRVSAHHGGCSIQSLSRIVLSLIPAEGQQTVISVFTSRRSLASCHPAVSLP